MPDYALEIDVIRCFGMGQSNSADHVVYSCHRKWERQRSVGELMLSVKVY